VRLQNIQALWNWGNSSRPIKYELKIKSMNTKYNTTLPKLWSLSWSWPLLTI
jgi:hypothetical protein